MAIISPAQISDGTTIDAADVNNPINTIANEINGNLDNNNIKSGAAIDGAKLADNSITASKLLNGATGWTPLSGTPNTVTYNGNRSYTQVYNSTDLTGTLSPGMRLKFTNTVSAPNQCTSLDGSTQYFSKASPAGVTFTSAFTAMAWVKVSSYSGGAIISRDSVSATGSGWEVTLQGTGQIIIFARNATGNIVATTNSSIPLNKWVHVAGTINAATGTSSVYFDGIVQPVVTAYNGTTIVQATTDLTIGKRTSSATYFAGKIAQVALFSSALSQATIQSYISQGLAGTETSLISAYSFNNLITDLNTTNANNLTASGSAVATNADSPFAQKVDGTISGTTNYGIVMNVSYSTNTTLVVQVPEGNALPTSGGISAVQYSTQANPYGFIGGKDKWIVEYIGKQATTTGIATISTWTIGIDKITVPIGSWKLGYQLAFHLSSTVSGIRAGKVSLASSTPVSLSYGDDLAHSVYNGASSTDSFWPASKFKNVNLTTQTTYTIYGLCDNVTGVERYLIRGDGGSTSLYAEPSYI